MFNWVKVADRVDSSYRKNNIGWLFYSLVRMHQPTKCIEIGALYGYSAIFTAAALKHNKKGHLQVYDVWHTPMSEAWNNLYEAGVYHWVSLNHLKAECVPAIERFPIDFIHIDIGNDGETYRWALDSFAPLTPPGALMVLEGGTDERNQLEWMMREGKRSIIIEEIKYHLLYHDDSWDLFVFEPFPGVTVAKRLGEKTSPAQHSLSVRQ